MDSTNYSNLVGLIYDVSQDENLWPSLLTALDEVCEQQSNRIDNRLLDSFLIESTETVEIKNNLKSKNNVINSKKTHKEEIALELLIPHFIRSLAINKELAQSNNQQKYLKQALNQLPIGIIVVDKNGLLITKNSTADSILQNGNWLINNKNALVTSVKGEHNKLQKALITVIDESNNVCNIISIEGKDFSKLSIMALPFEQDKDDSVNTPSVGTILFVSSQQLIPKVEANTLKKMYCLTPAESRMVIKLIQGLSINEIAHSFKLKRSTLTSQLKSVFIKVKVTSQSALIRTILTSPAIYKQNNKLERVLEDFPLRTKNALQMQLIDGRILTYAEYGDSKGKPHILMHGISGSRFQYHPDESILKEKRIRLIIPDRPGFGQSCMQNGRTRLDWVADVEELANYLCLKTFSVIGFSIGGSFALACAHQLKKRVKQVTIICCLTPFKTLEDLQGMPARNRMIIAMSRYAPTIMMPAMQLYVKGIKNNPHSHYKHSCKAEPEQDKVYLKKPEIKQNYINALQHAVHNGGEAIVHELGLSAASWGFELSEIKQKVHVWYGGKDTYVPTPLSEKLILSLPNTKAHYIDDGGHYLFYRCWQKIVEQL